MDRFSPEAFVMTDWSEIVGRHGPLVWRTAWRLLHRDADVADCFQRTFLSAVELSRREEIRDWAAVLCRLATARALEQLRRRCTEGTRFSPLVDDCALAESGDAPDDLASAKELGEQLRSALAVIDPLHAQVFCLACLEDWSYQEIATRLGITVNHVGVLLNRARASLRERLVAFRPERDIESSPENRT
jgi:RNA polymerase sigma-70 factor, ECF subfamily